MHGILNRYKLQNFLAKLTPEKQSIIKIDYAKHISWVTNFYFFCIQRLVILAFATHSINLPSLRCYHVSFLFFSILLVIWVLISISAFRYIYKIRIHLFRKNTASHYSVLFKLVWFFYVMMEFYKRFSTHFVLC